MIKWTWRDGRVWLKINNRMWVVDHGQYLPKHLLVRIFTARYKQGSL